MSKTVGIIVTCLQAFYLAIYNDILFHLIINPNTVQVTNKTETDCAEDKWAYELHIQAMEDANHL